MQNEIENLINKLNPDVGKTNSNVAILLEFLDKTGGRKPEPAFDETGWPLTRQGASLSSLIGGVKFERLPIRAARRMAQEILEGWSIKY